MSGRVAVFTTALEYRGGAAVPIGSKVAVAEGVPDGWLPGAGREARPDDGTPVWVPPETIMRVTSVLPVALRRALRATPWPGDANALAYVLRALHSPGFEDAADAFEFMVRAFRMDLLLLGSVLGFTASQIDTIMAVAAQYPGAEAVYEDVT